MTNTPSEYNELVLLAENNDAGVVADVIDETHTPNSELRELANDLDNEVQNAETKEQRIQKTIYRICAAEIRSLVEGDGDE